MKVDPNDRAGPTVAGCGTLSLAPLNQPIEGGDWIGCAMALCAHVLPTARPDSGSDIVLAEKGCHRFANNVTDALRTPRALWRKAAPASIPNGP